MGHRALVAYGRTDGTFTLRYAHWGQDLADRITPATPLGGPAVWPDREPVDLPNRLGVDQGGGYDPPVATRVDPRPLAVGVTAGGVLDALDPAFESFVVVSPTYQTTTYLVRSLDPVVGGAGRGGDELVLARPDSDRESLRAWFVETKSRLSAAVADGTLTRESARVTLRRALAARATIYSTDDASFLRDR